MNKSEVLSRVVLLRSVIRKHRDQIGDDRCWIDDYWLWELLSDTKDFCEKPNFEDGMKACRKFYEFRRKEDFIPRKDTVFDDRDLNVMSDDDLFSELTLLESAIRKHRDILNRPRTWKDDEELYMVLPDGISADFRLPPKEEFLDGVKEGCGCPNFWKSHENCEEKTCDLHNWGPCTVKFDHFENP